MKTKEVPTNSGCATTEGDELYYEVRGQGQPLLMIPGGGGDGGSYSLVAKILSRDDPSHCVRPPCQCTKHDERSSKF